MPSWGKVLRLFELGLHSALDARMFGEMFAEIVITFDFSDADSASPRVNSSSSMWRIFPNPRRLELPLVADESVDRLTEV